jgi:O-antigen/teichoic acid export membrane protein
VVRVLNLALGVLVTALVARLLGQAGYGEWSTIFIVLTLTEYFTNFGMETVVVREAARHPDREREWLGAMILARLLALGPVIVLSVVAVIAIARNQQMLLAGLILITAMPFGGVGIMQLVFQLRVNNLVPMLVLSLRSVLWGGAVGVIYLSGPRAPMVELAVGLAATNAVGSLVQAWAGWKLLGRWPRLSRARLGPLLRAGIPLGLSGVLIIAYARIDQVLVFLLAGNRSAGLYGSVYTILDQSHFVPISILTTLAPVIAASWPANRPRMLRTMQQTAELMVIASAGALAFAIVAATPVVRLIFGSEFVPAAPALPVLGAAFVFICLGYLNGNVLVVLGLQKRLLKISVAALAVNVAGNLALVPAVGFMGAAWMTLVTELVVFAASLTLIWRTLELGLPGPGRIGRTAFAAILLWGGLTLLDRAGSSLAVLVAAACALYPALLVALRAISIEDMRVLLRRGAVA